MNPLEMKIINLDLKTEVSGKFTASAYLYYGEEYKKWIEGNLVEIYQ